MVSAQVRTWQHVAVLHVAASPEQLTPPPLFKELWLHPLNVVHVAAASGDHRLLSLLCEKGAPLELTDRVSGGASTTLLLPPVQHVD